MSHAPDNLWVDVETWSPYRPQRILHGRISREDYLALCAGQAPFEVRGRHGLELSELWREGGEAYLGTVVSGFPNLFMLIGPNTDSSPARKAVKPATFSTWPGVSSDWLMYSVRSAVIP